MKKTLINPPDFSLLLGAFSHGVRVEIGDTAIIFVTGQLPIDAAGNLVSENAQDQTRYVFENIRTILRNADAELEDVVKVQIFVADMNDFDRISEIRNEYFKDIRPASLLVAVAGLATPGAKLEMEAIAMRPIHR